MDQFSLFLDTNVPEGSSLHSYLSEQIRSLILSGDVSEGARLPPSRELAASLGIARGTIVAVYDELAAEGFLTARQGSSTVVAPGSRYGAWFARERQPATGSGTDTRRQESPPLRYDRKKDESIDFRPGIPDLAHFPRKEWAHAQNRVILDYADEAFSYGRRRGALSARKEIAAYLRRAKGISCSADQIFLLSGSVDGFALIRQFAMRNGVGFVTEDPAYHQIPTLFATVSPFCPLPVDDSGLRTDLLPPENYLIYVTPSHQFPLGGVLPIQRRIQLVEHAAKHDSYIVEDDYDGEFRFTGSPIPSLAYLREDRVVHVGTFSKTLCGALRLGYMVVPTTLVEPFALLRSENGQYPAQLQQYTLFEFMRSGAYERHLRRMRKSYTAKKELLCAEVQHLFENEVEILGTSTGMHVVLRFHNQSFDEDFLSRLRAAGVLADGVWEYNVKSSGHRNEIILGYGNLSGEQIAKGILRLRRVVIDSK